MKIALIGSRLGYIDRGFESFTRNLFELLKEDLDITLLKGAGTPKEREVVVPSLWFEQGILSRLGWSWQRRMLIQERSFALALLPHLLRHRYDVIHFSEVVLGKVLLRWRRLFGLQYRLLFSNGAPAPPEFYRFFDLIQEVSGVRLEDALQYGLPAERLRLVPYGIDCRRFRSVSAPRAAELRRHYRIPADRFVLLCVAAIKQHHKRIDALIAEVSQLEPNRYFLLVAGHRTEETPALEQQAKAALGDDFRFLTVPHESIHEVYQLADLFVLPSLTEGLGIVILEAMSSAIPVLVHHDPLFRWVVDCSECTLDMSQSGLLRQRIATWFADSGLRARLGRQLATNARDRFDWQTLKPDYLTLYRDAARIDRLF